MNYIFNKPTFKLRRRSLRKNQTDSERLLWSKLRNKQLLGHKFFRQYSIGPFIADFYCPKMRLAIELDGGQHSDDLIKEYDKKRTQYLDSKNIVVIRLWDNEVLQNIQGVLETIIKEVTPPNLPLN